ncbi:hypothetical protein MMC19_007513 [Ptychographa xylographoides]|nr:hypothetical protein [Ptychographa xylographoides]
MAVTLSSISEEHRVVSSYAQSFSSSATTLGPVSVTSTFVSPQPESATPKADSVFEWDLKSACSPMQPVFHYISKKLAQNDIHVAVIIVAQTPQLIPVWPINAQAQGVLAKVIKKASKKHPLSKEWTVALSVLCEKTETASAFQNHRARAYLVHRSLVQRDLIFSGEGLTLLSVDTVYTFKSLLRVFSKQDWVPASRNSCKDLCVQLLHQVHGIYTGTKLSKSYLKRAYDYIHYDDMRLEEICQAYQHRYGKPGLTEMEMRKTALTMELVAASPSESPNTTQSPPTAVSPLRVVKPSMSVADLTATPSKRPTQFAMTPSNQKKVEEIPKAAASPKDLPKLVTKDLDGMAVDANESPECFYLYPISSLGTQSARPRSRSRAESVGERKKQPQSARPRSRSRGRADSTPTQCPLGITGIPLAASLSSTVQKRKATKAASAHNSPDRMIAPSPAASANSRTTTRSRSAMPSARRAEPRSAIASPQSATPKATTSSSSVRFHAISKSVPVTASACQTTPSLLGQLATFSMTPQTLHSRSSMSSFDSSSSTSTLNFEHPVTKRPVGLPGSPQDTPLLKSKPTHRSKKPKPELLCARCQLNYIDTRPTPPSSAEYDMPGFAWQSFIRPSAPRSVDSILFD